MKTPPTKDNPTYAIPIKTPGGVSTYMSKRPSEEVKTQPQERAGSPAQLESMMAVLSSKRPARASLYD